MCSGGWGSEHVGDAGGGVAVVIEVVITSSGMLVVAC